MYYDAYMLEQLARNKQMDRMAEARNANRWAKAREALRHLPKPNRVR